MNKDELLQELVTKISTGEMNREEVMRSLNLPVPLTSEVSDVKPAHGHSFSVMQMLYGLGAVIVVVGIIIFVSQIWDDIGSFGRILVTLGLGLITTLNGSMLLRSKPDNTIGTIFHFIGGMLIPSGSMVTLNELSTGVDHPWVVASTFGVIAVFYALLNTAHKTPLLTFFGLANGTVFIYLAVNAILGDSYYGYEDIYAYLTMLIGVNYLLLGYAFREGWNKQLVSVLHFFGATGFLGAAFSQVFDSGMWELFYFFLVIGGVVLSVFMKSRIILIISTLFLVVHVSYITGEYFADSLGWPVSLILLGFIFIGLGYVSVNLNKKYIAQ
jgi:hypothetical protein